MKKRDEAEAGADKDAIQQRGGKITQGKRKDACQGGAVDLRIQSPKRTTKKAGRGERRQMQGLVWGAMKKETLVKGTWP